MNINIVTVNSGWILQKIAERIYSSNPSVFSLSYVPVNNVDANLYIDIQNCFHKKSETLDIGYFTHLDKNDKTEILSHPHWLYPDFIVHMCYRYLWEFSKYYPENQMKVLKAAEPLNYSLKKITLGIFQRGKYEGKGFHFMMKMLSHISVLQKFKFIFVGSGWDEVVEAYKINGIECEYHINENYDEYENLYNKINYLLIPSLWEGGPMSVFEAYSKGIPIISSNVGWVSEFDIEYIFNPNNDVQLSKILEQIYFPIQNRHKKISLFSYKKFGNDIINIVKLLHERKNNINKRYD